MDPDFETNHVLEPNVDQPATGARPLARSPGMLEMAHHYKSELLERMSAAPAFAAFAAGEPATEGTSNLLGVGFGAKSTEGAGFEEELAVRVYVRTKLPVRGLPQEELIPDLVNGLPTDVIALGDLRAQARPTLCGVSVGHHAITAGTLGCLVRRLDPGDTNIYILSNNHVLANTNDAAQDDEVLEPGPMDGGSLGNPIGFLTDFEPLRFGGLVNVIDAAIARLGNSADVGPRIHTIGAIAAPVNQAALYQSVRKRGRTTLHTVGVILDLSADIRVRYGTRVASFEDQLMISGVGGPFSDGGDSGSLVVDAVTRSPVALLFAGGNGSTFATPIQRVLDRFGVEIIA